MTQDRSQPSNVPVIANGRYGAGGRPVRSMGLREVQKALEEAQWKDWVPSLDFGPVDPLDESRDHVCPCRCGAEPRLISFPTESARGDARRRHQVQCPSCGTKGTATIHQWAAVVEWCRMSYDARFPIERFPFFNLAELELSVARDRLTSIRLFLELRKQEAKKRRLLGEPSGKRYSERIEAYLSWTLAGGSLLRQHAIARARNEEARGRMRKDAA